MPWGDWINPLPIGFFLAVHVTAFALGAGFAWLAFKRDLGVIGVGFSLFALAELSYMTYTSTGPSSCLRTRSVKASTSLRSDSSSPQPSGT